MPSRVTAPYQGTDLITPQRYLPPMTTSAATVINALTERRADLSPTRQHLLLFFCQGHHLADTGTPLFPEPLHATLDGVQAELDGDTEPDTANIDNRQLGTVGRVLHRYGDMTTADLSTLVVASSAWQLARRVGDDTRIEWMWLTDWFRRPAELGDEGRFSQEDLAAEAARFVAARKARSGG